MFHAAARRADFFHGCKDASKPQHCGMRRYQFITDCLLSASLLSPCGKVREKRPYRFIFSKKINMEQQVYIIFYIFGVKFCIALTSMPRYIFFVFFLLGCCEEFIPVQP
ncbi:hypothetical protein [Candidatus Electronema sp. TJ]|uniref:hypothetical protein n=1 Tax=Candidatus Electronema sp. TJ TaxID=3401573 RepID=UPI003AA98665